MVWIFQLICTFGGIILFYCFLLSNWVKIRSFMLIFWWGCCHLLTGGPPLIGAILFRPQSRRCNLLHRWEQLQLCHLRWSLSGRRLLMIFYVSCPHFVETFFLKSHNSSEYNLYPQDQPHDHLHRAYNICALPSREMFRAELLVDDNAQCLLYSCSQSCFQLSR